MAERLQFIAEEFQPHRPRTGQRPNIQNAAAQGDFALLGDLGFRFVTLLFEPFNQIQGIDFTAALQRARAFLKFIWRKSFLEQSRNTGDEQR